MRQLNIKIYLYKLTLVMKYLLKVLKSDQVVDDENRTCVH